MLINYYPFRHKWVAFHKECSSIYIWDSVERSPPIHFLMHPGSLSILSNKSFSTIQGSFLHLLSYCQKIGNLCNLSYSSLLVTCWLTQTLVLHHWVDLSLWRGSFLPFSYTLAIIWKTSPIKSSIIANSYFLPQYVLNQNSSTSFGSGLVLNHF